MPYEQPDPPLPYNMTWSSWIHEVVTLATVTRRSPGNHATAVEGGLSMASRRGT
jgi:hypothetical protein